MVRLFFLLLAGMAPEGSAEGDLRSDGPGVEDDRLINKSVLKAF